MKSRLLFVLPYWRPQADGVSDYALRLGEAWQATTGERVGFIAWHGTETGTNPLPSMEGLTLAVDTPLVEKKAQYAEWWRPQENDIISWQIVPWAWHPRGFLSKVAQELATCFSVAQRHVFFHEIWLGEKPGLSWKHRFLGWLQQRSIRTAMRTWSPRCTHTSNSAYHTALTAQGWPTQVLPLPNSIPLVQAPAPTKRAREWAMLPPDYLRVIIPFSVVKGWPADTWVDALQHHLPPPYQQVALLSVGQMGAGEEVWSQLRAAAPSSWHLAQWGTADIPEVSFALQHAHKGLSTHSWSLRGKSSSIAAMRDYGLPVLIVNDPPETRRTVTDTPSTFTSNLFRWTPAEPNGLSAWLQAERTFTYQDNTPKLIQQWQNDLDRSMTVRHPADPL